MKKNLCLLLIFLALTFVYGTKIIVLDVSSQAGYITVSGRWWYWIDEDIRWPLAFATVVIYDLEPDSILYPVGTPVLTDINGYFNSGSILNDDGAGENGLDIVVGVLTSSSAAEVINPSTSWYYYTLSDLWPDCPDGPLNVGENLNVTWSERGAWRIFSADFGLTAGYLYLATEVDYITPTVTCFWPYGERPMYVWPAQQILLPDWACWWPDIILHEYGHHVMYSLYGYIPPSMEEHYMRIQSNSTTAWAEGWANFFPLVIFNDPVFVLGINATHGIPYNLETPHWCSAGWDDGDEVEGRVAGALWDIFDSDDDGYDVLDDGFQRIWNITRDQNPDTFKEFWDAWNTTYYTHPKGPSSPYDLEDWNHTLRAIFQNSIDYRGPGDVNVDGKVRVDDVLHVALLFGTDKGDPEWDKLSDVAPPPYGDDKIRIDDVNFVVPLFGNNYDC